MNLNLGHVPSPCIRYGYAAYADLDGGSSFLHRFLYSPQTGARQHVFSSDFLGGGSIVDG